jgi:hypothetical protein
VVLIAILSNLWLKVVKYLIRFLGNNKCFKGSKSSKKNYKDTLGYHDPNKVFRAKKVTLET